jgi:CBS domain containing-hemolysin-like protein
MLGSIGPGVAVGVLTVLVLIFGEVTPKSLATRYSERISLVVSPIVLWFQRTIYPVISLFEVIAEVVGKAAISSEDDPTVTESELISMVGYGEEEGTIDQGERVLIERAFALSDLTVADVMTPRHKVFTYDGRTTVSKALEDLKETPYSRIPLFSEDPDEIQTVLYMRDLMVAVIDEQTQVQVGEIGREAKFVPDTQPVTDTISGFRKEQQHMAIVVDEHGTMEGVVTFEDLLEELVGEIYDESDQKPVELVELGLNKISVDGAVEVRLIEEYFGTELPGKSTDTINRWILDHTERIPVTGETFALDDFEVLVKSASRRRIHEVTIERLGHGPSLLDM